MQDPLPRLLVACDLGHPRFCSFARIDTIDLGRFPPEAVRKPIARLIREAFAGLARPWLPEPRTRCDDDALEILGNADRMETLTRSQWHARAFRSAARLQPSLKHQD
jgi:hypothetical protein